MLPFLLVQQWGVSPVRWNMLEYFSLSHWNINFPTTLPHDPISCALFSGYRPLVVYPFRPLWYIVSSATLYPYLRFSQIYRYIRYNIYILQHIGQHIVIHDAHCGLTWFNRVQHGLTWFKDNFHNHDILIIAMCSHCYEINNKPSIIMINYKY